MEGTRSQNQRACTGAVKIRPGSESEQVADNLRIFSKLNFFGFYNSFAIFDTRRFYLHFRDFRTKIKFWHSVFKCQKEIIKPPSGHKNHDRLKRWLSRDHLLKEQDNDVKWLIFLKTIQNVMIMVLRFLWFGTWGHPVWHERYTYYIGSN